MFSQSFRKGRKLCERFYKDVMINYNQKRLRHVIIDQGKKGGRVYEDYSVL